MEGQGDGGRQQRPHTWCQKRHALMRFRSQLSQTPVSWGDSAPSTSPGALTQYQLKWGKQVNLPLPCLSSYSIRKAWMQRLVFVFLTPQATGFHSLGRRRISSTAGTRNFALNPTRSVNFTTPIFQMRALRL